MDQIIITGIRTETIIGVYDWERYLHRPIIIDLILYQNLQKAGRSDNVKDTIDYATVTEWVCQQSRKATYQLLEALAENLAAGLIAVFNLNQVKITLHKPNIIDNVDDIAISIIRP